ncbi:6-phospho-3-hexuloisomerase [Microbacterium halimionae]|uniref:6-phospho-3-hexuloisomerase n=1 Tax=Microbacterium halimionae TaxID=1526413 RepID=A0A7W3JMR9_9MICO|nr:6-phospho-3-hexuloisomerase [Microbacterium halimionae]MBA8815732.1 6-phospho-3-hexuloisomerase [Microbacterium halimionae]NII95778.1 6-phospho-3-hexuloisomerase [Microbacterium halimionae]
MAPPPTMEHMDVLEHGPSYALSRVSQELSRSLEHVAQHESRSLSAFADAIAEAPRVFVIGAGRSGLALKMTAMRLMHLGLEVHVAGEVTTPAISSGDLLITASGSGTTTGIVSAAETAVSLGAKVAAITTAASSPLAKLSSATIVVPAAGKLDRSEAASVQYAGSLFEQAVVLIGDAVFHALWRRSGASADDLWPRHSNLE